MAGVGMGMFNVKDNGMTVVSRTYSATEHLMLQEKRPVFSYEIY